MTSLMTIQWVHSPLVLFYSFILNSLKPRQNRRYNADDIFKCIFLNENVWFPTKTSLKFVPKDPINTIQALVLIMAWRRPGDKPLSELMIVSLRTHLCVTRPQWVKLIVTYRLRVICVKEDNYSNVIPKLSLHGLYGLCGACSPWQAIKF